MIDLFALGAFALACFTCAAVQIYISRAGIYRGIFRSVAVGFVAGFMMLMLAHLYLPDGHRLSLLLPQIALYGAFSYCYFHFNNMGYTARRVRLVQEIDTSGGGLTYSELIARYTPQEIVQRRIGRLLDGGQIRLQHGLFVLGNPSGSIMMRIVKIFKWIVFA